jgi:predicted amidohydrolase
MYVVFTNAVGGRDRWVFSGGAAIFDPEGRPLARAPASGAAVVHAELRPEELTRMRTALTMLAERRRATPHPPTAGPAPDPPVFVAA